MQRATRYRRSIRQLAAIVALGFFVGFAGCGRPNPADRPVRPRDVLEFDKLFAMNCAGCHGAGGTLGAAPPLADPLFLAIASKESLHDTISQGRSGTLMPAFAIEQGGTLTPEQINVLIDGIKQHWSAAPDHSLPPDLPAYAAAVDGPAGDALRGEQVFSRACANCHGEDGRGGENAGDIRASAFLALTSQQFLRRIVITGRPELGMPDYRRLQGPPDSTLSPQDIDDVVALLLAWRKQALSLAASERREADRSIAGQPEASDLPGSRHARID
ncbi:MAG: c-type cytochrome [Pirellulales bacterium]|nr:c-type cytochrome [Pirellulales bacterium]